MRFENRLPPEGINTPRRSPLREFFKLSAMALLAIVALGFLLNKAGGTLGGFVPFKAEVWLAKRIDSAMQESGQQSPFQSSAGHPELQAYLQSIADKVVLSLDVQDAVTITLHYSDENVVNAYATIGGHVYFFQGLLRLLPHENALAMLMAHEISHVTLRHTAKGLGGGLAVVLGASVFGLSGEGHFFNLASQVTASSFSRTMETEADLNAMRAVNDLYGHVAGTDALFRLFMLQRNSDQSSQFEQLFSTHPLDQKRVQSISDTAEANGWLQQGDITPLPKEFKAWLRSPE